jgi:single-strand DNA-binding protein
MSITITVAGNAVADPSLRFTGSGNPVGNLRVASTERRHENGSWVDGPTTFLTVTAWNALAEHVAETVHKGDRLLVQGRLTQRDYQTSDGEQRTSYEVVADDIAVSLRYAAPHRNSQADQQHQDDVGQPRQSEDQSADATGGIRPRADAPCTAQGKQNPYET